MMIISSGTTTKKNAVRSLSVRIWEEALMRCLMKSSSLRILSSSITLSCFMTEATLSYSRISSRRFVILLIHSS